MQAIKRRIGRLWLVSTQLRHLGDPFARHNLFVIDSALIHDQVSEAPLVTQCGDKLALYALFTTSVLDPVGFRFSSHWDPHFVFKIAG